MISADQLQEVLSFDGGQHLVLSVYLNLDPERQLPRSYQVVFADLLKQVASTLDAAAREALEREAAAVRAYLDAEPPQGKGLAIFSCAPRALWQTFALPVAVADNLAFGRRPYLRPLLDVLDEYERYAVALVDKEKARLFTVYLGAIQEHEQIVDLVPGKHEQGGWSQANYQRHHEAHVYWHLKRVATELSALLRRRPFDRLVLAGPDEAVSELVRLLPRALQRRLVKTIPAEMFASEAEILERTLAIEREIERAAEERLVADILDRSSPDGTASRGIARTLEAVWQGRVHKLVVAEGLRLAGSECPACSWLTADASATCPLCNSAMQPLDDIVERALERTLDEAGTIEVVHGPAAERLLQEGEGMGALLRFVTSEAPPSAAAEHPRPAAG